MHPYLSERLVADKRQQLLDRAQRSRLVGSSPQGQRSFSSAKWWDRIWPVLALGRRHWSASHLTPA